MAVNASGYLFGSAAKEVKQRFAFVMLDCHRSLSSAGRPIGWGTAQWVAWRSKCGIHLLYDKFVKR